VRKSGGAWSKPIDLSNSKKISAHPSIACGAKGKVYLCWSDNSQKENAADIWCAIGKNGEFAKPINISDTPGVSSEPAIVGDDKGRVAIAWSDTTSGVAKPDIFVRVSTDNGDDFSNVMDVTNTQGCSKHPSVAFSGSKLIVGWEEIVGSVSTVKATSVDVKDISAGPVDQVNPTIHRVSR
jgi:hypothetical protein